jgi:hypothetical protein
LNKPVQITRSDSWFRYGMRIGYDFLGSHRAQFEFFQEKKKSNVVTYSAEKLGLSLNYIWMFPSLGQVARFVKTTERDPANGVFEGDGG